MSRTTSNTDIYFNKWPTRHSLAIHGLFHYAGAHESVFVRVRVAVCIHMRIFVCSFLVTKMCVRCAYKDCLVYFMHSYLISSNKLNGNLCVCN